VAHGDCAVLDPSDGRHAGSRQAAPARSAKVCGASAPAAAPRGEDRDLIAGARTIDTHGCPGDSPIATAGRTEAFGSRTRRRGSVATVADPADLFERPTLPMSGKCSSVDGPRAPAEPQSRLERTTRLVCEPEASGSGRSVDRRTIRRDAGTRPISRSGGNSLPKGSWWQSLTDPRSKTRVGADHCRVDLGRGAGPGTVTAHIGVTFQSRGGDAPEDPGVVK
jgi:hypothetical protein